MDFLDFLDKENFDPLPPLAAKRERSLPKNNSGPIEESTDRQRIRVEKPNGTELSASLSIPPELSEKLYPYQREGIAWLYQRHRGGCGCVLADEMGLGKTIQVASFVGCMARFNYLKTVLIVVPGTLLNTWQDALVKWGALPSTTVEIIHKGTKAARIKRWQRFRFGTAFFAITTYGILKSDSDELAKITIDYAILDEAHLIKDPSSESFKAAKALKAIHRIGITGTPLMNNYNELWALMNFADENILLSNRADFSLINNDIQRGNERDATGTERATGKQAIEALRQKTKSYILRREKKSIDIVLGKKTEYVLWVKMNTAQENQYRSFLESDLVQVALRSINTSHPLVLLTALKRICDHPWLNFNERNFIEAMSRPNSPPEDFADFGDIHSGPKLGVALKLIRRHTTEQARTIVFSRSKRLLQMLSHLLCQAEISCCRFDGDTPMHERSLLTQQFNEGSTAVCLATTQVGGVGVTFTGATRVILLDPSWNPGADAQAVDRVHRIGQTNDVIVYRLITSGTVDEKVYRNQIFKMMAALQLNASNQEGVDNIHRYFTHTQLRNMFEVDTSLLCQTAIQLRDIHPDAVSAQEIEQLKNCVQEDLIDVSSHSAVFTLPESNQNAPTQRPRKVKAPRKVSPTPSQATSAPNGMQDTTICNDISSETSQMEAIPNFSVSIPTTSPILSKEARPRCTIFDLNNSGAIDSKDCQDTLIMVRGVKFARLHMSEVHRGSIALEINDYMLDSDLDEQEAEDNTQEENEVSMPEEPHPYIGSADGSARVSMIADMNDSL